jgi:hypothetical protein
MLKPITGRGAGTPVKFKRSQEDNQQIAQAVRPQLPRDNSQNGRPIFASGELPKGGYQSMWGFGDNPTNTKDSPTTKPGRKIY